jgi:4-alpha-glucanotransferase
MGRRRAGLIVPLFSCPSSASWGIGELPDVEPMAAWLTGAGLRAWQLLPINEMAPGQQSPYSAISAMAIDPIFIRLPGLREFESLGGEPNLPGDDRDLLDLVRGAATIDYARVRALKSRWLRASFRRFRDAEWRCDTPRARELKAYVSAQAWWIEDYSLFRAIHGREEERPWTEWPLPLQRREPAAIDRARRELADEVLYYQYLQWIADTQWQAARARAGGVELFGDLPFMVDIDSADVWARQQQFNLGVTIGAPPDAFSAEGQDWGTPLYEWDVIAREDYRWLRERARRCANLFDGFRIDHLVGFYRTYGWPKDGRPAYFTPAEEREQLKLGETLLRVFREPGADIIAEDLGTVPDFVRESLARQGVPGFKVFRWERRWHDDGQPFRAPAEYPAASVAVSGTHDTEPMILWWERASADERAKVAVVVPGARSDLPYERVRDALLEALFASGSDLVLLPVQDVFGWRDRINDPAVVGDSNWVYRLPWPADRLDDVPEARERRDRLRAWAAASGRSDTADSTAP